MQPTTTTRRTMAMVLWSRASDGGGGGDGSTLIDALAAAVAVIDASVIERAEMLLDACIRKCELPAARYLRFGDCSVMIILEIFFSGQSGSRTRANRRRIRQHPKLLD